MLLALALLACQPEGQVVLDSDPPAPCEEASWYLDVDGDGYGSGEAWSSCEAPTDVYVAQDGDCDDFDEQVHPGAEPACDGGDHDCDGQVDNDADGDGYASAECGGVDCDDADAQVFPGQYGECAFGASCAEILAKGHSADGLYSIDPDGAEGGEPPETVYCDLSSYGGGWTLVAVNAGEGSWNAARAVGEGSFGEPSGGDYKADQAWASLPFRDLMFTDGVQVAVYGDVDEGTRSWMDFVAAVPQPNCGSTDGYSYPLTEGDFAGDCDTALYVHPMDEDGGLNSSCDPDYAWGDDATGPAWSVAANDGCPLDDPGASSFVNGTLGPWQGDTLRMFVR